MNIFAYNLGGGSTIQKQNICPEKTIQYIRERTTPTKKSTGQLRRISIEGFYIDFEDIT